MGTQLISPRQAPVGRRRHSRLRLCFEARLITLDGTLPATLLDLSLTGARVATSRSIPASGNAVLTWGRFEAFCTIAWTEGERCGLDFDEPLHGDVLLATRNLADTDPDLNSNGAAQRAWTGGFLQ